jgi:hypothetical protein
MKAAYKNFRDVVSNPLTRYIKHGILALVIYTRHTLLNSIFIYKETMQKITEYSYNGTSIVFSETIRFTRSMIMKKSATITYGGKT